jgi:dCMP deaminase
VADVDSKWDRRLVRLAKEVSSWSKDRSRKVGCIIIGPAREILATGYNGFPRGCNDDIESRHQRPAKYMWTEHAERNAIYNAARRGIQLESSTIYVPWFPCVDCTRAIIQCGMSSVIAYRPDLNDPTYADSFRVALEMLEECCVAVRYIKGKSPIQK